MKITNQDIKKAKTEMKHRKISFQRTCRDYKEDNESKQREKELYVKSQIILNDLIEKQIRANIELTTENIIKEGDVNSNTFWRLRKKLTNHNKGRVYTVLNHVNEEGESPTKPR